MPRIATSENPCITCGACCAAFRVSFYWAESDPGLGGVVPEALTERVSQFCCAMKGTARRPPRCVALDGTIGQEVRCTIYAQRPSTCHEFGVQGQDGNFVIDADDLIRCNRVRIEWGLPELEKYKEL